MRVVSQNGRLDFPYENSIVFISPREETIVQVQMTGDYEPTMMAQYSTAEKAKKAMEMLRIAYENNEFYHHTGNSERFAKTCQALSEEMFKESTTEYFQFPQDDEIEV